MPLASSHHTHAVVDHARPVANIPADLQRPVPYPHRSSGSESGTAGSSRVRSVGESHVGTMSAAPLRYFRMLDAPGPRPAARDSRRRSRLGDVISVPYLYRSARAVRTYIICHLLSGILVPDFQ
ncbi:hypothetical protein C8R47DRAFT_1320123, partial [Mycena vitilis]